MQLRTGPDTEKLQLLGDQSRFLEQLPLCGILDPLVDLNGAAAVAPAVVVCAELEEHTPLRVFDDDAGTHLDQGAMADEFA